MDEAKREELINKIAELEMVKRELKGRKLLEDLYEFNKQVLQAENLGPLAPFHKEMCDFVMNKEGKNKKLILVPRGHLKSSLITVGYSLLRIAQNPKVRILIANATYDMACSFLTQIKKHLQNNEIFKDLYGDLATGASKWSENMITVPAEEGFTTKEATITTYGVGGNLVSQHYDLIIMDDVVNRDLINTPEQIQKTILFYKDALDLLEPNGILLVIGTRWHQNDLYGWILDQTNAEQVYKGFDVMIRRAYEGNLEEDLAIVTLYPHKFTRGYLLDLKRDKGPWEFSSQYLNDVVPIETAKFKPDWFKVVTEDELRTRNIQYYTTVDPAIGLKKENDKTAIVTIGVDEFNNWFLVNIIWGQFLPSVLINYIFTNWEAYHPKKIGIEMVAFQKSIQYALHDEMRRRNIFLNIQELKATTSKDQRIEGLIPRYANGTIFHLQQCPHRDILEEELIWYPRGKHDDIVDALSYQMQIALPSRKRETKWWGWGDKEDRKKRFLY
jgi:predicted phage terminase large subunit-like protein